MNIQHYAPEDMLRWLEHHFAENGYTVERYADAFLPARVPLHCEREKLLLTWERVPGDHSERLQNWLGERLRIQWVKDARVTKTKNGATILVSTGRHSARLTLNENSRTAILWIDDKRTRYFPVIREQGEHRVYDKDELVIEITTDGVISKDAFFPRLEEKGVEIPEASPVIFYRYYFPKAKVFIAYPDYAQEDDAFEEFKRLCDRRGVGLLRTSEKGPEEVVKPSSLFDRICEQLIDTSMIPEDMVEMTVEDIRYLRQTRTEDVIAEHLESCLHQLVYYPHPQYGRRAIAGTMEEKISYVLIDKLLELENIHISYIPQLKALDNLCRRGVESDYEIASRSTRILWEKRLGLDYPEIHRHLEEILLRDEMYREHFVHQFQVFLMGAYLLDRLYKTKDLAQVIRTFNEQHKCPIEDAWLAASTYHDFNYGLQSFDDWMLRFFEDTLRIADEEAKEHLNLLNLDAAMVRESLFETIRNFVALLDLGADGEKENKARKFLYEKAVTDRNHGILSALSLLKLCKIQKTSLKVDPGAMLEAAFAVACHDEDVWEALSGCKGYRRSNSVCCDDELCARKLSEGKEIRVFKRSMPNMSRMLRGPRCEIWEQVIMRKPIMPKIRFDEWPLLFLLIYCDSAQEEGRTASRIRESEFRIQTDESTISEWASSGKKLRAYQEDNELGATEIKGRFSKEGHKLSDEAIICRLNDRKWKIIDGDQVYVLVGRDKRKVISVRLEARESFLSQIDVDPMTEQVRICLTIDGLDLKHKELERVAWVLEDERFKLDLIERGTERIQSVAMNGSGGG